MKEKIYIYSTILILRIFRVVAREGRGGIVVSQSPPTSNNPICNINIGRSRHLTRTAELDVVRLAYTRRVVRPYRRALTYMCQHFGTSLRLSGTVGRSYGTHIEIAVLYLPLGVHTFGHTMVRLLISAARRPGLSEALGAVGCLKANKPLSRETA